MDCPCGTKQDLDKCCGSYLRGSAWPSTAEQLMRSRYTAHVVVNVDYLEKTLAPESRKDFDRESTRSWAQDSQWLGLKIHATEKGLAGDETGIVEFTAIFAVANKVHEHRERSIFRRDAQRHWLFVQGS